MEMHRLVALQDYPHNRHHQNLNIAHHFEEIYQGYYQLNYHHSHHHLNQGIVLGRQGIDRMNHYIHPHHRLNHNTLFSLYCLH